MDAESIVELETVINLEGKGRRIVLRGHPRVSRWKEAERSHILRILQQTGGVVGGANGAAARLGLCRTTLISKMRRLRINHGQSSGLPTRAPATSVGPKLRRPRA